MTQAPRRRILIVEDEMLIAMLIEQMVEDLGYEVVGPAFSVSEALSILAQESCDCAILDVNLGQGEVSTPVAEALKAKRIPVLLASGYGSSLDNPGGAPILNKPFLLHDLERALECLPH